MRKLNLEARQNLNLIQNERNLNMEPTRSSINFGKNNFMSK